MNFINGFFLVNFVPFALLSILGGFVFFLRRDKSAKYYFPLLFIFMVLAVIAIWRIPVISERRYAMPALVPGIVISVFTIILIPDILRRLKIKYTNAIVRLAVVVLLLTCAAKTMRFQESKQYLHEISEIISADRDKYKANKSVLLIFGAEGGDIPLDPLTKQITVRRQANNRLADTDYQFYWLYPCPEDLKASYPIVYLLCVEPKTGDFAKTWMKKYLDKPALIYEYIRDKDQVAYRLYRIVSNYQSAWVTPDEFEKILIKDDMLGNSKFKNKYLLPPESQVAKVLRARDIIFSGGGNVYLPSGWLIDPGYGWQAKCSPVSIKWSEGASNILHIQSNDPISLYSEAVFDGGKTYLIAIRACSGQQGGTLRIGTYFYTSAMKYVSNIGYREIILDDKNSQQVIPLKLDNCEKFKLTLLISGDVSISNIMIVPAQTTNSSF